MKCCVCDVRIYEVLIRGKKLLYFDSQDYCERQVLFMTDGTMSTSTVNHFNGEIFQNLIELLEMYVQIRLYHDHSQACKYIMNR